jgi:carbamoyl-phosphate synthase small subunit
MRKVKLILEDGKEFIGNSFGSETSVSGEVVFNTSMSGYPENLTDPSYRGQILVLTYPLIGNYGVPGESSTNNILDYFESEKIQITSLIVSDYSENYSHWNAVKSLGDWLKENKIPAISGIDTRMLTKHIREHGTMLGKIVFDEDVELIDPNKQNLTSMVSIKEKTIYGNGSRKVLLVDCGVKNNIIRNFLKRDTTVIRVPFDYDFTEEEYDGIFLSNGPGDPKMCQETIKNVSKILDKETPIFGICLGNQILALASGADTYKLKYGHRSHNQPVLLKSTNKCYITSQNHGFAIDDKTIGEDWETLFINLNDGTNEGLKHKHKPFFSCQFHPEASSGPVDTEFLFDDFLKLVDEYKNKSIK